MDFTQGMSDEEEGDESAALTDSPSCCPICSYVWTAKDCVLSKEIHVNKCLERVGELQHDNVRADTEASPSVSGVSEHNVMCPICGERLRSTQEAEIHVNKCLDDSCTSAKDVPTQLEASEASILSTSSRCPVCLELLPAENLPRRVRHIKNCASKANVKGPRDLDGSDYQGMLDVLIEEAERVDSKEQENQSLRENCTVVLDLDESENGEATSIKTTPARITEYFGKSASTLSCSTILEMRTPLAEKSASVLNILRQSTTSSSSAKKPKFGQSLSLAATPRLPMKAWHTCPSWKRIPQTTIIVDGFEYAHPELSTVYFLSHFHYDHYIGLTKQFNAGVIYCGPATGRLVINVLKVHPKRVKMIPLGERTEITEDVYVTLFDANHAPGSCVMLFEIKSSGKLYLHTGDFRANEDLAFRIKHLTCQLLRPIETLFLDTTYCNEQYDFLQQEEVIRRCKEQVEKHASAHTRLLVLFGTYTIGKERIALGCLPANKRLAVTKQKMSILRNCDFSVAELSRFTTERSLSSHWMVGMNELDITKVEQLRKKNQHRFDTVLAVRATGWVKSFKLIKESDHVWNLLVPYSEHSSFGELKKFVRTVNPRSVVPTVMTKGMTKEEMLRLLMY